MSSHCYTRRDFIKAAGLGATFLAMGGSLKRSLGMDLINSSIPKALGFEAATQMSPKKPNIVLIMADDMGYSDIGCYGGEIHTPNLDGLAAGGLRFTQFYNTARCCPTRASLMTGLYAHQTGMGWMTAANLDYEGYRGDLNNKCVTIAEVLKQAGYSTYMTGKWHLTYDKYWDGPKHSWPRQRGFDRFYGTIAGGGSYFNPNALTRDNTRIKAPAKGYYYTDAISDNAVKFITEHNRSNGDKPFFIYVPFTAVHYPIVEPQERIDKYDGKPLTDEQKRLAACATHMDSVIGQMIDALQRTGQRENTLIVFASDNGAHDRHCPSVYWEPNRQCSGPVRGNKPFSG